MKRGIICWWWGKNIAELVLRTEIMRDILTEQCQPSLNIGPGHANLEAQLPKDHIKITLDLQNVFWKYLRGTPNQHRINAAAEYMPFRDSSLPTITTQSTFQVMFDQKAFLRELHRVLKPKGLLIITIEYGNTYNYAKQQFKVHPDPEQNEVDNLLKYIKSLGLHILVVKYLNLNGAWGDTRLDGFSLWIIGEKEKMFGKRVTQAMRLLFGSSGKGGRKWGLSS